MKKSAQRPRGNWVKVTRREYRPYALAVGQFALAWNDLYERLAMLYAAIIRHNSSTDTFRQSVEVFGSARSDRDKRDMLLAAVRNMPTIAHFPKLARDVTAVVQEANSLEDPRNNIIHSPVFVSMNALHIGTRYKRAYPAIGLGNFRATRLFEKTTKEKKDLLDEARSYLKKTMALADFVILIGEAITGMRDAWPRRPRSLNLGRKRRNRGRRSRA